jgi:xylulokinase
MRVLALDVGTSAIKAAVLDIATSLPVGPVARIAYDLDYPNPDAAEIPPQRLWSAITAAARAACQSIDGVEAVGLGCLTPALVLLDQADRPLGPIWTHLDRRARPVARQVWQDVGADFLAEIGNRPLPGGISVTCYRQQLLEDPSLRRRIGKYLHVNGWLALRLTGEPAFDPGNASFSGLFGTLTSQTWSARWCDYFQVDPAWLPSVVCGTTTVGTLRREAAEELGLSAGLPVKLGSADTSSAMLAAEMKIGDLLHTVGTTQVVAALTEDPRPGPQRLTRLLGFGKAFIHVAHNPVGGAALAWLRELCFREQSEQEFYSRTVPSARQRSTRVELEPAYLGGDRLEIDAHRAAFCQLTLATDRMDLLTAVLQALERKHREALAALGLGERFCRVFLTGGGAEIVRPLIPEYAGATVQVLEEGSLRGIAYLFRPPVD